MPKRKSIPTVVSPRRRLVAVPEEDLAAVLTQLGELRSLVHLALDLLRLVPGIGAGRPAMTPDWELEERLGKPRPAQSPPWLHWHQAIAAAAEKAGKTRASSGPAKGA